MRIATLVAATMLVPPAALAAQLPTAAAPAGPRVGIMAGLSSATISGNDFESGDGVNTKRRNGFVGGLYLSIPLAGSPLSVRPELLYAQKGVRGTATFNTPNGSADIDVTAKLDYLELPVLLQFTAPNTAGLRPALYVGPSVAYRLRCASEGTVGGTSTTASCDDATGGSSPRKFDVSGVSGGQLGFALGGQSLGVGVRYTYGFTNLAQDVDGKNRTLSVYGAIDFPFGR